MKKVVKWIALIAILAVIVYLIDPPFLNFSKGEANAAQAVPTNYNPSIPVSGIVIKPKKIHNKITVTGSVRANESVELKSEISGKIQTIYFLEGTNVNKGDLLVSIKDDELTAELEKLRYNQKLYKDSEYRQKILLEKEAISQEEYDRALTELYTLFADIKIVEAKIAKTKIRAPFDGTIGLRYLSEGSYITSSDPIATLYSIDPAKVDFAIPERYSSLVQIGDEINFTTESVQDVRRGKIYAIEPQIDTETRSLNLRAKGSNKDGALLPGQFARIEIIFNSIDNAIMVPTEAVIPELGGHKVYVNRGGKAESTKVNIGLRTESELEITSGLVPNDTLITSGILQIRPGSEVNITLINSDG